MSVRQVGVQEARQLQADEEYTYVDVRSVPEFENGHPAGAHNVQANYPTDAKLLIGCQMGGRSSRAAQILEASGYEHAVNVAGGFGGHRDPATGSVIAEGWSQAGLPMETGSSDEAGYEALRLKVTE